MKIKRDDTEESRKYWQSLEENSKIVDTWPEWKKGAPSTNKKHTVELKEILRKMNEEKVRNSLIGVIKEMNLEPESGTFGLLELWFEEKDANEKKEILDTIQDIINERYEYKLVFDNKQ